MKILVFSDSHKKYQNMDRVLQKLHNHVAAVLHLGDGIDDARRMEKKYAPLKFHYVCGNCDFDEMGESKKTIHISGKKIFMTHGHLYNVKMGYERISYAASQSEADICLFGHTHTPVTFNYDRTLFLNPGSIAMPNWGDFPSYGVLEITDLGVINPSVVGIQGETYKIMDVDI